MQSTRRLFAPGGRSAVRCWSRAAGYTAYEALRPLASGAAGRRDRRGRAGELPPGHGDVLSRGSVLRDEREANGQGHLSRSPRSARISGARCRSARARAASSARVTARSSTSAASGSPVRRRVGWTGSISPPTKGNARRRHRIARRRPDRGANKFLTPPRVRAARGRPDVPRERPQPPPFEPEWLDRSLNRYLVVGARVHAPAHRRLRRVPRARALVARTRRTAARVATAARQEAVPTNLRRVPRRERCRWRRRPPSTPRSS